MALHEQCVGATDEWYTPPFIFNALGGSFDMDVASPGRSVVPWIPAVECLTENSLGAEWRGFLWMNAPYGGRNGLVPWLDKFVSHGNGICLVPDRTSAPWWRSWAAHMDLILFVSPKIKFIGVDGQPGKSPAQGACLGGMGRRSHELLHRAASNGLGVLLAPVAS